MFDRVWFLGKMYSVSQCKYKRFVLILQTKDLDISFSLLYSTYHLVGVAYPEQLPVRDGCTALLHSLLFQGVIVCPERQYGFSFKYAIYLI